MLRSLYSFVNISVEYHSIKRFGVDHLDNSALSQYYRYNFWNKRNSSARYNLVCKKKCNFGWLQIIFFHWFNVRSFVYITTHKITKTVPRQYWRYDSAAKSTTDTYVTHIKEYKINPFADKSLLYLKIEFTERSLTHSTAHNYFKKLLQGFLRKKKGCVAFSTDFTQLWFRRSGKMYLSGLPCN